MRLTERVWVALAEVVAWISPTNFDPFNEFGGIQRPLLDSLEWPVGPSILDTGATTSTKPHIGDGNPGDPIFKPPTGRPEDTQFRCDYRAMKGWRPCSTPSNRECWLRHPDGREFNIMTDYEHEAPIGVQRNYTLVVNDGWINADGRNFTEAKIFNNTYPGPWIQACWGDTVNVKVINKMIHNGTSIHWHGIRQNQTAHADGVNGVTQCPIAPGRSFYSQSDFFRTRLNLLTGDLKAIRIHTALRLSSTAAPGIIPTTRCNVSSSAKYPSSFVGDASVITSLVLFLAFESPVRSQFPVKATCHDVFLYLPR